MRRRSVLGLMGIGALAGCVGTRGSWPEEGWIRPTQACFLALTQNMGGGSRMDGTGRGQCVLLDAATGQLVAEFPYRPIDQAKLCVNAGRAAWASADGVHVLSTTVDSFPGSELDGSLYGVVPAGDGFVVGINAGMGEDTYDSGLTLFDPGGAESWVHDGWIPFIGWADGQVVGYSYRGLDGEDARLTVLGPGPRHGDTLGDMVRGPGVVWSENLTCRGDEVIAIVTYEDHSAHVVRTNMRTSESIAVPMSGVDASGSSWHVAGDGPGEMFLDGDWLVWRNSSRVCATNVDTGVTEARHSLERVDGDSWWLHPSGLVQAMQTGQDYRFVGWVDGRPVSTIDVHLDGPKDQTCWAAAYLPELA